MRKTATVRDDSQRQQADRRISRDWEPFARNLDQVLSRLEEDQFLILTAKHGNRYLQFSCQGSWGMRAEVVSNHYLEGDDRLSRKEMSWLRNHGWNAPTGKPTQATPDKDPDGSPNYHIDFPASVPVADIASLAVDTLIHGLALPYPGALSYQSFGNTEGPLAFDELGLKPSMRPASSVMDQVLSVFREVTGMTDLDLDMDGDVTVRYGAIVISAIQINNQIPLISALTTETSESPSLLRKLNQINDGEHRIRLFLHDDAVLATLDVPAEPFVPDHLVAALAEFSEVAEGLAIVLRAELAHKAVIEPSGAAVLLQ